MKEKLKDYLSELLTIDDFKSLLNDAVSEASNDFEVNLSNDLSDKFEKYKENMFLSEKQFEAICKISRRED